MKTQIKKKTKEQRLADEIESNVGQHLTLQLTSLERLTDKLGISTIPL